MLGKNVERFSKNRGIIHQNGHKNTLKQPPARFEMIKKRRFGLVTVSAMPKTSIQNLIREF